METEILQNAIEKIRDRVEKDEPVTPDFTNDDITLLYSLGHSLYKFSDYAQAKKIFQQLIISKPLERKHWHAFACSSQMTEDYEQALVGYSLSAMLDENDPFPHFHAGECLYSLGDYEEGERALGAAEERLKETPAHEEMRGKIEALRRNRDGRQNSSQQPTI